MEIMLTDSAKEELKKILDSRKENTKALRIFLAGYG
jgi:Fe-S cluster assembly iron-binding protein IscA